MANIEAWEQRIRDEMEQFAHHLNTALSYACTVHNLARQQDPDGISEVSIDDPKLSEKLVPQASKYLMISETIKMVIEAGEDENLDLLHQAMKPVTEFTEGMTVTLGWIYSEHGYRMSRVLSEQANEEGDERHPFATAALVFWLDDYLARYYELVHLGVCRYCCTVYVKPKHGRKQRYCSRACQQKAYRARKAEKEEAGS